MFQVTVSVIFSKKIDECLKSHLQMCRHTASIFKQPEKARKQYNVAILWVYMIINFSNNIQSINNIVIQACDNILLFFFCTQRKLHTHTSLCFSFSLELKKVLTQKLVYLKLIRGNKRTVWLNDSMRSLMCLCMCVRQSMRIP